MTNTYTRKQIELAYSASDEEEDGRPDLSGMQVLQVDPVTREVQDYQDLYLASSILNDTHWENLNLSGVQFTQCVAARMHVQNCLIHRTFQHEYEEESKSTCADFKESRISGIWSQVIGSYIQFVHANLHRLQLDRCWLYQANFSRAILFQAQLTGTWITESCLERALLVDIQGSEAFLMNNTCRSTNLSGANLSGANLSSCDCSYALFAGTNLSGALLQGTTLTWANLTGVLFGRGVQQIAHAILQLQAADLLPVKGLLFTLLGRADQQGKRAQMERYCALLVDPEQETMPDLFQMLDIPVPSEAVGHMKDGDVAVKHFLAGMIPILDEWGMRHPHYSDIPLRLLVHEWMTAFLDTPYALL